MEPLDGLIVVSRLQIKNRMATCKSMATRCRLKITTCGLISSAVTVRFPVSKPAMPPVRSRLREINISESDAQISVSTAISFRFQVRPPPCPVLCHWPISSPSSSKNPHAGNKILRAGAAQEPASHPPPVEVSVQEKKELRGGGAIRSGRPRRNQSEELAIAVMDGGMGGGGGQQELSADNVRGIVLALLSSGFIGSSFIIKKKGLRRAAVASGISAGPSLPHLNAVSFFLQGLFDPLKMSSVFSLFASCAGVGGHSYLLEPLWWVGMITSELLFYWNSQ